MPINTADYLANASAQMRKGILEFCVLLTISEQPAYTTDIINTLKTRDLLVVEGTLYPLLSRLREAELVKYEWIESREGPPRKYYSLTNKGQSALKELTANWHQLATSLTHLIKRT